MYLPDLEALLLADGAAVSVQVLRELGLVDVVDVLVHYSLSQRTYNSEICI